MIEVQVLGGLRVRTERGEVAVNIRRSLALLAYVSLEGTASRERLAALFWGDMSDARARANLRMTLHKLRGTAIEDYLEAGPHEVRLSGELRVDLTLFREHLAGGKAQAALDMYSGPFLHHIELSGSDAWEDWVRAGRASVQESYRAALEQRAAQLETQGELQLALDLRLALLSEDELEEGHHREVIRLHYLLGHRGAALRAFARCRELLRGQLGLAPLEATLSLAHLVETGETLPEMTSLSRSALPVSVLRPPRLIGRQVEWSVMRAAWTSGQAVLLIGEPGSGKSRLAADLAQQYSVQHSAARQSGRVLICSGRPGDELTPYVTLARTLRALIKEGLAVNLPLSIRQELARIVPELLSDSPMEPSPLRSQEEKTRFLEAVREVFTRAISLGLQAAVLDDLQFMDQASLEALLFAQRECWGRPDQPLRTLYAVRRGTLSQEAQAQFDQATGAGLMVGVTLEPLGAENVGALVVSLELPGLELEQLDRLSRGAVRFAGGNPQWVLEAVKSALETGTVQNPDLDLELAQALSPLLARRLERLSPAAKQLSQVLGVTGVDLDLAAHVLKTDLLDLLAPLVELELAQVIAGGGFTHDLMYEAVLRGIPEAMHVALHKRCAVHLETLGADPGQIARHWAEGGEQAQAAPHWAAAAQRAEDKYRHVEAAELYQRASEAFAGTDEEQELQSLKKYADLLRTFHLGPRYAEVVDQLLERSKTPHHKAGAWQTKADYLYRQGQGAAAEQAARAGYQQALISGDMQQRTTLLNMIAVTLWQQRHLQDAAEVFEQTLALCKEWGETGFEADTWVNLGVVQSDLQRYPEAFRCFEEALSRYRDTGNQIGQAHVFANHGSALRECGQAAGAVPFLLAALGLYRVGEPMRDYERRVLTQLALARRDLGEFGQALLDIEEAARLVALSDLPAGRVREVRGEILLWLGAFEEAEGELSAALALSSAGDARGRVALLLAWWARWSGQGSQAEFLLQAQQELVGTQDAALRVQLALFEGVSLPGTSGVQRLAYALEGTSTSALLGLELRVRAYLALKLLDTGEASQAFSQSFQAIKLLERATPTTGAAAEIRLAHVLALRALGQPDADQEETASQTWLLTQTEEHVPEARRADFLQQHPVHRAIVSGTSISCTAGNSADPSTIGPLPVELASVLDDDHAPAIDRTPVVHQQ